MEYIDGEDLASLLRRIGRLPHDKAVELGHQLCAGLAAAHDNGLLHRDLKPANIMIDGRGRARITDFGLALRADEAGSSHEFAGTPAYMAPELLSGGPASVRSDIYALGLILYEMFTGKRPFEGESRADWTRVHIENTPRIPSTVTDVSPAVERAILRCLSKDPNMRPASALQVSAALPGGDPLAAAMAAGETPSPEMVAAAGQESGIKVKHAIALLLGVFLVLGVFLPLARRATLLGVAPITKSPDVLTDRAQTIIHRLGYTAAPADHYNWTAASQQYMKYRADHDPAPERIHDMRDAWPGPYRFTYRQSPVPLSPQNNFGAIDDDDPPMNRPGMVSVTLNAAGQLLYLRAVPPEVQPTQAATAPDWSQLFTEAGLNLADFKPVDATFVPPAAFDNRASWQGTYSHLQLTIEAASFAGKPVFFNVRFPWTPPPGATNPSTRADFASMIVSVLFLFVLPFIALLVARRNIHSGRGDTAGASRLAVVVLFAYLIRQMLNMHYGSGNAVLNQVIVAVAISLFLGACIWVSYVALEPMVRRQSPHLSISWARLISGRFTDPLVGRDILIGVGAGLVVCLVDRIPRALPYWKNVRGVYPELPSFLALGTTGEFAGQLVNTLWNALFIALIFLFIVTLGRAVFKRMWAGGAALFVVLLVLDGLGTSNPAVEFWSVPIVELVVVLTLLRVGPVALAALMGTQSLISNSTVVLDSSAWYSGRSWLTVAIIVALSLYGFRNALAGRSLLASEEARGERSVLAAG
jgi:serine/threonine-protein kinase